MKIKILKYCFILFNLFIYSTISSQTLSDTIKIKQVNINDKKSLKKTGIITHKVDSNILSEEQNTALSEILSKYTPVFVKNYGRTSLSTVSIRGTAASHTDVLLDGVSLKSPMLGQVDFSLIPNNIFDNISVNYGNSSIYNASGAIGGNINLNNKTNWNNKLSGNFIQDIGSYTTINDFLKINAGNSKIQTSTSIYNNYSKNDFSFRNKNIADIDSVTGEYIYPIQKNKNAEFFQKGIYESVNYRKNKFFVSLNYWYQNTNRSLPRLNTYEGDDCSNINKQNDENNFVNIKASYYKNKTVISYLSAFVNNDINYTLSNYIQGKGYDDVLNSFGNSKTFTNKLDFEYKFNEKTFFKANYSFNMINVNTFEKINNNGYNKKRNENYVFVSFVKKIKRLSVNTIIRQNYIDNKLQPVIPFVGLDYKISNKHNIHLSATASRNYHLPSLNDLYWQPGGNPNLKPEESKSVDFSITTSKRVNNLDYKFSVSPYYSIIKNWIIWLPSPFGYWSPYNIYFVESKGIETNISIKYKIKKVKMFINTTYAYTSTVNKDFSDIWGDNINKQLPYIPKNSFNFFVKLEYNNYYINYLNNSFSERYTSSSQEISSRDWLYPYYMNNLSIGKLFIINKIQIDSKFKIYNLFNEEYRTVLGRPMPGINFLMQINIKF